MMVIIIMMNMGIMMIVMMIEDVSENLNPVTLFPTKSLPCHENILVACNHYHENIDAPSNASSNAPSNASS